MQVGYLLMLIAAAADGAFETGIHRAKLSLCCRWVAQRDHSNPSRFIDAIDDVSAPNVIPYGEDLPPDIRKAWLPGLKLPPFEFESSCDQRAGSLARR